MSPKKTKRVPHEAVTNASSTKSAGKEQNPAMRGPVVLATRGSSDSASAATVAQLIAAKTGKSLSVVSVIEPVSLYGLPTEMHTGAAGLDVQARDTREADIKGPFAKTFPAGLKWRADVRVGQPASEICDAAKSLDATIVVLGASPHRRLRRIVAGQRAAQVLHGSESPVLSVAPWLKSLPKNVVAAIDFNAASLRAAQAALLIMEQGGVLILVNVIPASFVYPSEGDANSQLHAGIGNELKKVASNLQAQANDGVRIETAVLDGEAATEMLDFAEEQDADLVAVGTRGESAIRRVLVGSVATTIFHSALCSVLASPPPESAESRDR